MSYNCTVIHVQPDKVIIKYVNNTKEESGMQL